MEDALHTTLLEVLRNRREYAHLQVEAARKIESRYPWLRLIVLVIGLMSAYLAFHVLPLFGAWTVSLMLLAIFVLVTIAHRRVIQAVERYQALEGLASRRIARSALDWKDIPAPFQVEVPPEHPFNRDLLVTGERSLHQLVDSAASAGGSMRLAGWFLEERPQAASILKRQTAVQDLLVRPGLRLRLALAGALLTDRQSHWDGDALLKWVGSSTRAATLKSTLILLGLLAGANILLFILSILGILPAYWIVTFLIYMGIQGYKFRESSDVFGEAYDLVKKLGQVGLVFREIETYPCQSASEIARLCSIFQSGSFRPYRALRIIGRIASAASIHMNPFLSLIINLLVPWDLFFAYQLERFKRRLKSILPTWLDAWYDLEALCSLAEFALLNPAYTFPVLHETNRSMVFNAEKMGHPLISYQARVNNDFGLASVGSAVLITGSNMSGKSTFLRTTGANLCLTQAGSVVAAASLSTLPFRMFASMNVSDSLSDGISYFYAEVRRLKSLLDALIAPEPYPLFYLIDEIFRGTNNRERRIGSESYLHALAGGHGAGLISTHDLELVRLADEIPVIENYHFREDISNGQMIFDYLLRPGSSPTTNALRIMELAGLPVNHP